MTLDIKCQKKWKYVDRICGEKEENGDEIFVCEYFGGNPENVKYSWFYSDSVSDQIVAAEELMEKLKVREEVT